MLELPSYEQSLWLSLRAGLQPERNDQSVGVGFTLSPSRSLWDPGLPSTISIQVFY